MIFEFVLEGLTIKFMSINTTFLTVHCFSDKNKSATSSDLNIRDGYRAGVFRQRLPIRKSSILPFIGKQRRHISRSLLDNIISLSSSTISRNISWEYYRAR